MSYKALLFCPDEKTARTVTQVLTELDFQVEPCNEPFAAVKKLTTEHFDGVVVDCDNEQNAALLFKSARNSASNQTSLAVAVVEGQSGVAKAFRIGANLVLTKPINVEQSKGTLRVARGLLRKSEAAKGTATSGSSTGSPVETKPPLPAVERPAVARTPVPVPVPTQLPAASASISSVFEVEQEPQTKLGPTDAALLESMPDPGMGKPRGTDSDGASARQSAWQTSKSAGGPMADALRRAAAVAGKTDFQTSETTPAPKPAPASSHPVSVGSGSGAAAAPAKEPAPLEDVLPSLGTVASPAPARRRASSGSKKPAVIVAILLLAAGGGYFGWTKYHASLSSIPFLKQFAPLVTKPSAPAAPAPSPASAPGPAAITTPSQPSAEVVATPLPTVPDRAFTPVETVASTAKKPTSISVSNPPEATTEAVKTFTDASDALVVRTETPKPAAPKPVAQEAAEPAPALNVEQNGGDQAITGLVDTPAVVPHAAPQTLKVSQGVSQGLLVKKVPPVYPPQAVQMHLQGSVQMLANISKDGDITNVKLTSGDPILARAALDAVKQWKYKPYYLNGEPVEIQTQIVVNFSLP